MGILSGKTALVTGGSRGIGRAIALRLAKEGARVCVNYRSDANAAEDTVASIKDAGGEAYALAGDVASISAIQKLFEDFASRGEGLDILINNAGVGSMAEIAQTDEELFDLQMDVNAKGTFFVTRAALSYLRDGGRIVNISSMVSRAAYPGCMAYAMSKAAVNQFTISLAQQLGERGITVNAVAPGATVTNFAPALYNDPETMKALAAGAALKRVGQPDDISAVVAMLVGLDGAWITGQVIEASGGMHL